jgi:hypothetical protein
MPCNTFTILQRHDTDRVRMLWLLWRFVSLGYKLTTAACHATFSFPPVPLSSPTSHLMIHRSFVLGDAPLCDDVISRCLSVAARFLCCQPGNIRDGAPRAYTLM